VRPELVTEQVRADRIKMIQFLQDACQWYRWCFKKKKATLLVMFSNAWIFSWMPKSFALIGYPGLS
jgi:hypothetical protein